MLDKKITISAQVKLVIWDLDETLWSGTLSEEGIKIIPEHIDMVRTLVDRGIMCSVCSKNEFEPAQKALVDAGIWDLFVFSHIQWSPKGQAIASMISAMGLRDENVLFLDDNHLNLEEAQFFNKSLMVVDGQSDLPSLLDLPELKGKNDKVHDRLTQYKLMQSKQSEQQGAGLSNIEFLRQSGIRIKIITDIENNMDRVLELLNRTNQLNYTKTRANSAKERKDLDELLKVSGMHAGLVHVQDRYGDYGVVGFFCVRTKFSGTTVHHMAFSCRTLSMGVEQWIWEYLKKPEIDVVKPVANPINSYDKVDWITEVTDFDSDINSLEEKRLCLVGGCDLLQVSFYCGTNRDEFVNRPDENGLLVRYDDVGFFINPRDMELKHSRPLQKFIGHSRDEMLALDDSLENSDLILLSMYFSVPSDHLYSYGGEEFGGKYLGTVPPRRIKQLMKDPDTAMRFAREMFHRRLPLEERLGLTRQTFEHAAGLKRPDVPLFILGATTKYGEQAKRSLEKRLAFNEMCRDFCSNDKTYIFVDIDELLDPEEFSNSDHFTRTGYFKIAEFVNGHAGDQHQPTNAPKPKSKPKKSAPKAKPISKPKKKATPKPAAKKPKTTVRSKGIIRDKKTTANLEKYMGFLLQEWPKLAQTALHDPSKAPLSRTNVLDKTIETLDETDGLRLEFGVWRGHSIRNCAKRFPNQHWYGFDSFEGFPDDGRIDWQKPFKVITMPNTPPNVTLVKGYFSDTLEPFLTETKGQIDFVNVDCDIYSSTVDIFTALEKHGRLRPGLIIYFDELINYSDYMWNESLALFEMLERTGLGVEWLCCDHKLRMPEDSIQHFIDGDHPVWMEDMRSGHWMQASCRLTDKPIDCGPVDNPEYKEKLRWMLEGFNTHEQARQQALEARNERLEEMERERERRYVERKKLEKKRQLENQARRKEKRDAEPTK